MTTGGIGPVERKTKSRLTSPLFDADLSLYTLMGLRMPEANPRTSFLAVRGLTRTFPGSRSISDMIRRRPRAVIRAVDEVDFTIGRGEVLGLAGESGSGKSVIAEIVAGLQPADEGRIELDGTSLVDLRGASLAVYRRCVSMVFQNPYDSLNPRWILGDNLTEPLRIQRAYPRPEMRQRALAALRQVKLLPAEHYYEKFPHELSGGERQRAAIARALILGPSLLIADEPTTMLDVSVRSEVLNLLEELSRTTGLAMLFISHDFSTLSRLCHRIAIIYRGRIVEVGPAQEVLTRNLHPYSQALSASIPIPDPDAGRQRIVVEASNERPEQGCIYAPRCQRRMPVCGTVSPGLRTPAGGHAVACHLYAEGTGPMSRPPLAAVRRPTNH
jgi:peptide/nickel transport system ATP-binding protein